jgi:aminoglycoside 3-N-acetyltransferase
MHDPKGRTRVTKADIIAGVRAIGLREGDVAQVHSSLSSFGYVEGGADAVVDALLEVLGPEGTLMMPTFNHGRFDVFDIRTTPSVNGAITEALRKRPEARRSMHPTHAYAAIGRHAEHLTSEHLELLTFDERSPLGKLSDMGGCVLLLGVGMNANTAAHLGETRFRAHCVGYRKYPRKIVAPDGSIQPAWSVLWRNGPCRIEWDPLEEQMRSLGMIRDGRIGDAHIMWMKARDVVETSYAMAQELCPTCPTRPRELA